MNLPAGDAYWSTGRGGRVGTVEGESSEITGGGTLNIKNGGLYYAVSPTGGIKTIFKGPATFRQSESMSEEEREYGDTKKPDRKDDINISAEKINDARLKIIAEFMGQVAAQINSEYTPEQLSQMSPEQLRLARIKAEEAVRQSQSESAMSENSKGHTPSVDYTAQ